MRKKLHLVRHGQIDSNVSGALDTAVPGPQLNATGLEQANALVGKFEGVEIDSIWASTAIRTQMTASPLAASRGLTLGILDGLREISAGELEMSVEPHHRMTYHEVITQWILGDLDIPLGKGTTGREVLDRFEEALTEIYDTDSDHTVVAAHGAIISFWTAVRCNNLTEELFAQYPVVNTGIVSLEPTSQGWRALNWMGQEL